MNANWFFHGAPAEAAVYAQTLADRYQLPITVIAPGRRPGVAYIDRPGGESLDLATPEALSRRPGARLFTARPHESK